MYPSQITYEPNLPHLPTQSLITTTESTYLQQHLLYAQCQWMPASQVVTASQTHHESSMLHNAQHTAQEHLSAYARWKMEDDEIFYRTFPQARHAAQHLLCGENSVDNGYCYDAEEPISIDDTTSAGILILPSYAGPPTRPGPTSLYYDHHQQIQSPAFPFTPQVSPEPTIQKAPSSNMAVSEPTAYGAPLIQSNVAAMSQPQEPPLMDFLPPPSSPTSSTSSYSSTFNDTASSPEYYQQTAYYENSVKAESPQSLPVDDPYSLQHSHSQTALYNCYPPSRPPDAWPDTRTPSPHGIRLSPLPPSKRPLAKKPPLACLFCRGRKIACGPSDPGSSDRSCNQCQRRSITCEYPLESRRGMRKKKVHMTHLNPAAPRVKLGRKVKRMQ